MFLCEAARRRCYFAETALRVIKTFSLFFSVLTFVDLLTAVCVFSLSVALLRENDAATRQETDTSTPYGAGGYTIYAYKEDSSTYIHLSRWRQTRSMRDCQVLLLLYIQYAPKQISARVQVLYLDVIDPIVFSSELAFLDAENEKANGSALGSDIAVRGIRVSIPQARHPR